MKFDKNRFNDEHSRQLEEMSSFFDERAGGYEEHMMNTVDGADEFYCHTADALNVRESMKILDIGCGTGLQIDEIIKINPKVQITGIDGSEGMLSILKNKYKDKPELLNLVTGDFMNMDFGEGIYDAAVSVMALHHFTHEEKTDLYKKIHKSLKSGGIYVECDYMAPDQDYEDFYFYMLDKIKKEQALGEGYFHYDTPCTPENQIKMLETAGFTKSEKVWEKGTAVLIKAHKG